METPPGIEGYSEVAGQFLQVSEQISFDDLYDHLSELWPTPPGKALDIGTGSGRDAAALAHRGYQVSAVEPTPDFLTAAQALHAEHNILWSNDCLPHLHSLGHQQFQLILCQAVWHHIDEQERQLALTRIAALLETAGVFAVTLRHGPPGAGRHVFPCSAEQTIHQASQAGLKLMDSRLRQPSMLAGKMDVSWSKLTFRKNI